MAYNHYVGGRAHRVEEPQDEAPKTSPLPPNDAPSPPRSGQGAPGAQSKSPPGALQSLRSGLDGVLSHLDPGRLDTEDLLVLAILWLLYRESGEKEMLIAMGAYLFL